MTFKFEKRTLFTALLAFAAVICTVLAISFLIPTSQTRAASADDSSHNNHSSGWKMFSSSSATLTSGKYYLDSGVSTNITISSGDVTLCLNGKALTSSSTQSAVIIIMDGASLTLCDCVGSGTISGTTKDSDTGYGAGVFVNSGATFIMEGGTITNNSAGYGGGVYVAGTFTMNGGTITNNAATVSSGSGGAGVYVKDGTFTMNGGTISENTSGGDGGGVYVYSGTFNMTGGTISENTADNRMGGGVYVKGGTFAMSGGSITGNTASSAGGGVYVTSSGTKFTMSDGVISGNTAKAAACMYVNGSSSADITGGYLDGAIGASSNTSSVTITGGYFSSTAYKSSFFSTFVSNSGCTTTSTNGSTYIYAVVASGSTTHTCSSATCSGTTFDKVLVGGGTISGNGNYFLYSDLDLGILNESIVISSGTVYLCLNGYTLTGTGSDSVITVSGGTLILCDCSSGNSGKITGGSASDGGGVLVNGGAFNMSGGTITKNTASDSGGGVYVKSGTFTMTGGTISDNEATKYGGGVFVYGGSSSASTFKMSGGTIQNNKAANGGGVCVYKYSKATFNMTNGTISGNTATTSGGGVYVNSNGTFTMEKGTISGNTATTSGGGVYVSSSGTFKMIGGTISESNSAANGGGVYSSGTFTMSDSSAISNNTASSNGGGVYVESGTFTMGGGTISSNTVTNKSGITYGGGVYVSGRGVFTMTDGTISGNSAKYGGGVYVTGGGAFDMSGGDIESNTANSDGGGVFLNVSTLTMSGESTITSNTASSGNGGGVYVSGGTFTMSDGKVSDNSETAIYVCKGSSNGTVTIKGGYIGGSCYNDGATFTVQGGMFDDSAYSSISNYIDNGYEGVNLTEFTSVYSSNSAYSSSRSKRSVENYYGVFTDGGFTINDVEVTYSGNECGQPVLNGLYSGDGYTVYVLYSWCGDYGNCLTLPTNAGEYPVTATIISVSADGQTVYAGKVVFKITIDPKEIENDMFYLEDGDYTYNGDEHKADVNCKSGGLIEDDDYTVTYSDTVSAGKVTVTIEGKGNYCGTVTFTYEIAKATVAVSLCGETETTYDGLEHSLTVSGLPTDGGVTVAITYSYVGEGGAMCLSTTAPINAGTYTVTAEFTSANYDISTVSATLTIKKADYNMSGISLSDSTVTYNGLAQSLEISGELPKGVTVTYYYVGSDGNAVDAPINAGTYTVTAVFSGDYDNYNEISSKTATLTIKKATLSVEEVTDVTASVGDSLEDIELPEGWSWEGSATLDQVGEYEFEATYSAGDNYETVTTTITVSVIGTGLSDGEIAGIVIAGAAFVILVAVLVVFVLKRKEEAVV